MKKKVIAVLLTICMLGTLSACGAKTEGTEGTDSQKEEQSIEDKTEDAKEADDTKYLEEKQIQQLFDDPTQFEGEALRLSGKIASEPEKDGETWVLHVWRDPASQEHMFIVRYDGELEPEDENVVNLRGTVAAPTEENIPVVQAEKVNVLLNGDCCAF